jgi:hypothetical protein
MISGDACFYITSGGACYNLSSSGFFLSVIMSRDMVVFNVVQQGTIIR